MNNTSKTDWDRVDARPDHEFARDAIADPDNPPIDEEFLSRARQVQPPQPKRQVTLQLDSDVLEWFKQQGKGYQTMINAVLRAYKDVQEKEQQTQ
ncbi:BrnA antitoxin family protein [Desulfonatronospira sp.]|uniref:BrnA antitoxin family protein n=1 Tax=Desulfonatronospira sp. TaxID=1962951 RepID=UPI0025C3CBAD|nr:BrnA antitoxin family protein [Desulfonatronospira sp.]